ncbi:hypothetical protein Droror1_Dr00007166 [Drosera rotundifolia]
MDTGNAMDSFIETSATDAVIVSIAAADAATPTTSSNNGAQNSEVNFGIKVPNDPSPMRPMPTTSKTHSEAVARRFSHARSSFLRSKSRLVEPPYPTDVRLVEESKTHPVASAAASPYRNSPSKTPPRVSTSTPKAAPITPRTPLKAAIQGDGEDDDTDVYVATLQSNPMRSKKKKISVIMEWTMFVALTALLVASLTVHRLIESKIWSLELWKWFVLAMVMFCGRLINEWLTNAVVFLMERNFLLKRKVLYFVYGMRSSVQVFLWLAFIFVAWVLLFSHGVKRSRKTTKDLHYITMGLAGLVVGAGIWLVKTLLVKTVAVKFHVNRFFDRIQDSLFHQYVLKALSGPPMKGMAGKIGINARTTTMGKLSFKEGMTKKEEVIDIDRLNRMKQEKVSAWTIRGLVNVITGTELLTTSSSLHNGVDEDGEEQTTEITSEWEAKSAAYQIFENVAKPGYKYIEEDDLRRFMKKEDVDHVFPLFEGATESGKIKKSALTKWVVNTYLERKYLAHSLNDTKTAVEELNRMASGIVLVVNILVWNLMMGFLTTEILLFISSQLLLVVFVFGNTAKMVFEAIIFVFIMHPFDIGDRCVIDGVQMVVDEMNILTTIFLRYDNEKITYPNSVLATKPISNFYRSPEMSDSVEFAVDFSTSVETISVLKSRIKTYIDSKPQHWQPSFSLQVKEFQDMNKMKMGLYVNHTINFQNLGEKNSRKCDLLMELKKIFEELGIKYHLLPQEVHVTSLGS